MLHVWGLLASLRPPVQGFLSLSLGPPVPSCSTLEAHAPLTPSLALTHPPSLNLVVTYSNSYILYASDREENKIKYKKLKKVKWIKILPNLKVSPFPPSHLEFFFLLHHPFVFHSTSSSSSSSSSSSLCVCWYFLWGILVLP
ncbi:hypothetical protein L228DRAFT_58046 [Xylona heveae TC161]|uniref:CNH domain-containing protein n=1 Tax=Xylona heveae (strain CBS 132557 / TC161) TaxID=1328760 RepID=A0A165IHA2_XYLHT|nr:hypothetical protein L228DRAFT_58046 [Xylona heveae TC161]KZF24895.1 hypothetical protein L228DRAFT_58046 [Xylona heveae TC161]